MSPAFLFNYVVEPAKLDGLLDDERRSPTRGVTGLEVGVGPTLAEHLVENRAAVSGLALGGVVLDRPGARNGIRRPRGRAVNEEGRPRNASISREGDRPRRRALVNHEIRIAGIEQAGLEDNRRNAAPRSRSRSTRDGTAQILHEAVRLSAEARAEQRPGTELAILIILDEVKGPESLDLLGLGSRSRAEEVQNLEVIDRRTRVGTRTIRVAKGIIRVGDDLELRSARREVEVSEIATLRLIAAEEERLAAAEAGRCTKRRVRDVAGIAVEEHTLDLTLRGDTVVSRTILRADAVSGDLGGLAVNELHGSLEIVRTARSFLTRGDRIAQTTKRNGANEGDRSRNHYFLHFFCFFLFEVGLVKPFLGLLASSRSSHTATFTQVHSEGLTCCPLARLSQLSLCLGLLTTGLDTASESSTLLEDADILSHHSDVRKGENKKN